VSTAAQKLVAGHDTPWTERVESTVVGAPQAAWTANNIPYPEASTAVHDPFVAQEMAFRVRVLSMSWSADHEVPL
jgi:hypothetical protein